MENKENNQPKTILVRMCEEQTLWLVHDSLDLDVSEYPELEGMTEKEMQDYISENAWEMKAPSAHSDYYETLAECLQDREIVRDKETGLESHIYFE